MRLIVASLLTFAAAASLHAEEPAPLPPPLEPEQVLAAFAPGQGREVTATACGLCHAPILITGKKYDEDKWAEVVDHMIDKGARVSDADYDMIVTYLGKAYGPAK